MVGKDNYVPLKEKVLEAGSNLQFCTENIVLIANVAESFSK